MQDIPSHQSLGRPHSTLAPTTFTTLFSIVERQRTDMLANTISKVARRGASASRANLSTVTVFDEAPVGLPTGGPGKIGPSAPVSVEQLANGVKVASSDNGGHVASIGIFVEAGSRFENASNAGAAHTLSHMAFKSTNQRSDLRLFRDMENAGVVSSAASGRDSIMYRVDCLRDSTDLAMDMVTESFTDGKFPGWEVAAVKSSSLSYELENVEGNAQALLSEMVHSAAYGGETTSLGRSQFAGRHQLGALTPEVLKQYVADNFTTHRVVLAGTNVSQSTLKNLAETAFSGLGQGPAPSTETTYSGGRNLVRATGDLTHVAVAFNSGGYGNSDLFAQMVLQNLLGGGAAMSQNGVAGSQSRLAQNVLGGDVFASYAFSNTYKDAGIFGLYGACVGGSQDSTLAALMKEMDGAAAKACDAGELQRAKAQLKAIVASNLESRSGNLEDIGSQATVYGGVKSGAEIFAAIDSVTAAQVKNAAAGLLKSTPSVAALGDISGL